MRDWKFALLHATAVLLGVLFFRGSAHAQICHRRCAAEAPHDERGCCIRSRRRHGHATAPQRSNSDPCVEAMDGSVSLTGVLRRETTATNEPGRPRRMFYLVFDPPICVQGIANADAEDENHREEDREVGAVGIAEETALYAALRSRVGARITMTGRPIIPHMGGLGSFCLFDGTIDGSPRPREEPPSQPTTVETVEAPAERRPSPQALGRRIAQDLAACDAYVVGVRRRRVIGVQLQRSGSPRFEGFAEEFREWLEGQQSGRFGTAMNDLREIMDELQEADGDGGDDGDGPPPSYRARAQLMRQITARCQP